MKITKTTITRILTTSTGALPKSGKGYANRTGWDYTSDCTDSTIVIRYTTSLMDQQRESDVQMQRLQRIAAMLKDAGVVSVLARHNDSDRIVLVIGDMSAGYAAL